MPILAFVGLCLIWGSTWMAIKINLESFPPLLSAGARFLVAAIVLFLLQVRGEKQSITWVDVRPAVVFGALNGLTYGLIYWAEQYISSSLTAILNGALPFFSMLFAALIVGERINLTKIVGLITGFMGLWVVFGRGYSVAGNNHLALYGQLAVIASAFIYALAGTIAKRSTSKLSLVTTSAWQMMTSAVVLLLIALILEHKTPNTFHFNAVAAFLYLSIGGSALAFYLYNYLLKVWEVTRVSYVSFITPIIATLLGNLILGEDFHTTLLLGLSLVLMGMFLLNRGARVAKEREEVQSYAK